MRLRGWGMGCALLIFAALPGQSCGPFFTEAVFVGKVSVSRAEVMEGKPGILWPEMGVVNLALMYRRLAGPAFTAEEKRQVLPTEDRKISGYDDADKQPAGSVRQWMQAEQKFTKTPLQMTGTDARVPGQDWQTYANCLDDAFRSAAQTLNERVQAHPDDKAAVAEWVRGQDAVFSNCANLGQLPADVTANAPVWLRQDRAYQVGAAHFYRAEWEPAKAGFAAIAADPDSPWRPIAAYMVGRTLLRQAAMEAKEGQGFDPALLRAAQAQFQDVVRGAGPMATPAQGLLNMVNLRIAPDEAVRELGEAIARPDSRIGQDLIDLRYGLTDANYSADVATAKRSDLVDWVLAVKGQVSGQDALARWRSAKSVAWLVGAMMTARSREPELVAAAEAVPKTSPAWATVTYLRLRWASAPEERAQLAALLPEIEKHESLSTANAFRALARENAAGLDEFVRLGVAEPAFVSLDGVDEASDAYVTGPNSKSPTMAGLPMNTGGAKRFTPELAKVLNEQLPLATLAEVVEKRELPEQLEFELAMAVWTRAVLLGKPEIAGRMTPFLVAGEKGWTPWLAAYDAAKSEDERKGAALAALMRFPSVRPYVNAGAGREEGFVGYSVYRDNWWCAEMGRSPGESYSGSSNYGPPYQQPEAGQAVPPGPAFLTPAMLAQAGLEDKALGKIGDAPAYFARETLDWTKAHPTDSRAPEVLGFAFRAMRNGCNLEASTSERRAVWELLHKRYPNSEWARKYPKFVDDTN